MSKYQTLLATLQKTFPGLVFEDLDGVIAFDVDPRSIFSTAETLRDSPELAFDQLIDLAGIDYLHYGLTEWEDECSGKTTYDQARKQISVEDQQSKSRYALVYQLLSTQYAWRVQIRCYLPPEQLVIDTVTPLWMSADWYEREAYDLFGIRFKGHHDLRRILTDYGFVGHPFRKDFPLSGYTELVYDATLKRCVYKPVNIEPRVTVAKVIRRDARYVEPQEQVKEN